MPLRIGFDMDGVLADFSAAYFAVEDRLFGKPESHTRAGDPEEEPSDGQSAEETDQETVPAQAAGVRDRRRRKDAVWKAIQRTPDFWLTLEPTDPQAVRRIHQLMLQHRWEVFFI